MIRHGFSVKFLIFSLALGLLPSKTVLSQPTSKVGIRLGETYLPVNIGPIGSNEISYMRYLQDQGNSHINWQLESQVGQLTTSAGNGTLIGIGPRLEYELSQKLQFASGARVVYLDRYKYNLRYNRKKHYGGHRQFQGYVELNYLLTDSISVGYRWQHMSNGRRYLPEEYKYVHNPSLDTHNLVIQIPLK